MASEWVEGLCYSDLDSQDFGLNLQPFEEALFASSDP